MKLSQRIMELLNGIPQAFPTSSIIRYCADIIRLSRSRVWEQLKRLERVKKVIKVSVSYGGGVGAKWISAKWYNNYK